MAGMGASQQALQEYNQALESFKAALPYFEAPETAAAKALTFGAIGEIQLQLNDSVSAVEAFEAALTFGERYFLTATEKEKLAALPVRAEILIQKARGHEKLQQFIKAVDSYQRAAADLLNVGKKDTAGFALWSAAGLSRNQLKQQQQAAGLYSNALRLFDESGKTTEAITVRLEFARYQFEAKNYQQSVMLSLEALKAAEKLENAEALIHGYLLLGQAFEQLTDFHKALSNYESALHWLRKGNILTKLEPVILYQKGKIHRLLGQYELAVEDFHAAIVKYWEGGHAAEEAEVTRKLAEVHAWVSDFETAAQPYLKALTLFKTVAIRSNKWKCDTGRSSIQGQKRL